MAHSLRNYSEWEQWEFGYIRLTYCLVVLDLDGRKCLFLRSEDLLSDSVVLRYSTHLNYGAPLD